MKLIKLKRRKPNRSRGGDLGIYIMLILFGLFFVMPLVYAISSAFKPLDEIYLYPPRFFVKNPTFNNFQDLLVVMSSSYVPFTRYVFNTVLTTLVGTLGHLLIGSMAAYVLAKYSFPGGKGFFNLCQSALMFNVYVLQIPTYLIMSQLGWVDTYLALIVPAFALPMGLFLMKQFMEQIPDALIEAAKIDGAGPIQRIRAVTFPAMKPVITFSLIMSLGGVLGTNFEQIMMFYNSALYDVADVIDTWVYRVGLGQMQYGYGTATSMMRSVVGLVLMVSANTISKKVSGRGMF